MRIAWLLGAILALWQVQSSIAAPTNSGQKVIGPLEKATANWIVVLRPGRSPTEGEGQRASLCKGFEENSDSNASALNVGNLEAWIEDFLFERDPSARVIRTFQVGSSKHAEPAFRAALVQTRDAFAIQRLEKHPDVESVEPDAEIRVDGVVDRDQPEPIQLGTPTRLLPTVGFIEQPQAPWNLIRVTQRTSDGRDYFSYGSRGGAGVVVYCVDTGIMIDHEEFEGRARWGTSFVEEAIGDLNGHGSHVAGGFSKTVRITTSDLSLSH
jgi:subtilisin family serine protease